MESLTGERALLTGAAGGIAAHIARALAAERIELALTDRTESMLAPLADELRSSNVRVITAAADLTSRDDITSMLARVEHDLGPIDILVNNAGVAKASAFHEYTLDELTLAVDVNVGAPLALTRLVLPGMLERERGHVVFISSLAGVRFSAIAPGFVCGAGLSADIIEHADIPFALGTTPPEAVARAVVKALRTGAPELSVTARPVRPVLVAAALSARLGDRLLRLAGIHRPFRDAARSRAKS